MAKTGETAGAIREWATDAIRESFKNSDVPYRDERATVQSGWKSKGLGWPQTRGEHGTPARVQVKADRYEIIVVLPPEIPGDFIEDLIQELRDSVKGDQTLGGRLRSVDIPRGEIVPDEVSDQEYGDGAKRVVIPVVSYAIEETNSRAEGS